MHRVRLVAFDLDDTLAPSKSAIPPDMARALRDLLEVVDVCVISGGQWLQFETQVIAHLDADQSQAARLHIMPTCGTRYLRLGADGWQSVYEHLLPDDVRARVKDLLGVQARSLGLWEEDAWGEVIEDRGSQITFSALGQEAPLEAKRAWDPSGEKRITLARALAPHLPDLEVRAGGSTSVDITPAGVDKAYGMRALAEQTGIALEEMVFVGDRLDPDGNDYPVKALGVRCIETTGPEMTVEVIDRLIEEIGEDT
ncbi:MAG: HAD-IIB family hydrolase [Actinomycetes bacterium]|nr:HAD-IIB family hydrolase [Actinomycetes bacterium]MDX5380756.1 HAD-IIB family hydrolase [Actinomycetes bacterium]MDX5399762.1 HAD-IIB family hydrolase [Actinomycetes bacterium]MDX5450496.1 HAD-IIB family hydrolase [Actinomycetes bacterium]